jgi:3-oxoacyl-[acyl-carrier-protein] synthase-1
MGAVVCVLSLMHQEVHPSVGFQSFAEQVGTVPNREYRAHVVDHAMANAFGFGGNCTSLIFSRT